MEKFYNFVKDDASDTTTIFILGNILDGWAWEELGEKDPVGFNKELNEVETANILVKINSYGGSVSAGLTIYNLLRNSGKNVTTQIEGFACSIASIIFLAGDKRIVNDSSLMMIHNAWSRCSGNYKDMQKASEDLEKINVPLKNVYMSRSNLTLEQVTEFLDSETWFTSQELLDYEFATDIINGDQYKNSIEDSVVTSLVNKIKAMEKKEININEPVDIYQSFYK